MFPQPVQIETSLGVHEVRQIKARQLQAALVAASPLFQYADEIKRIGGTDVQETRQIIAHLMTVSADAVFGLVSICTDIPRADLDDLPAEEFLMLATVTGVINRDFFVSRVLPAVLGTLALMTAGTTSSTS